MKIKNNPFLIASLAVITAFTFQASAARIYKDVTTTDLNAVENWATTSGGATDPTSISTSDALRFNEIFAPTSATNYTASLSADLSVGGIQLDSGSVSGGVATGNVIISSGNTLTLNGASLTDINYANAGIVMNSSAGGTLTINCLVNLGNSQRWVSSRNLTVTGDVNLNASNLSFYSAGGTTTVSGLISGTGNITRSDSSGGAVVISGLANTYSGTTSTGLGTLQIHKLADGGLASSIGQSPNTATNLVINAGTVLSLTGNSGVNSTDRLFTLSGASNNYTISNNNSTAANTLTFSNTGSISFIGNNTHTFRLGGTNTGANSFAPTIANFGANATLFTKADAGSWTIANTANTYTGATTLAGGNLFVTKLAIGGLPSSIGQSSNAAASLVFNGSALNYIGAGDTTDRAFTITSAPTINVSGSDALTWSGASPNFTTSNTAYTITLGGTSTADNTWGTILSNNGTGAIALSKNGIGKWIVTGNQLYTGATIINAGTLAIKDSNTLGGATGSTIDAGNIVFGQNLNSGRLEFGTVANLGAADQIRFRNTGGTAGSGGALVYVGTTDETLSKTIQCDTSIGIRLESNSVGGKLTYNGPFSQTNRMLYLGGTGTGDNTLATAFTGTGGLTKRDAGTWILTGTNTYTGDTTVTGGVLTVSGTSIANGNKLIINGGKVASTGIEIVNTLFFGTTQQVAGTWGATGSGATYIDDTRFSGIAGVVIVNTGPPTYASWTSTNDVIGQAADLDHDNDGVPNGVEYFIGGPTGNTTGFTALPGVTNTMGSLSVTWTKAASYTGTYGTDFFVETSTNLEAGSWTTEVVSPNSGFTVVVSGNNVTFTFPVAGPAKKFARLKVTGP